MAITGFHPRIPTLEMRNGALRRPFVAARGLTAAVIIAAALIAAPTPSIAQTPVPTPTVQTSIDQQLDQIQQRASALRELDFTSPVSRQFMNRDELRAYNQEMFFRDTTPEELDASQTLLETLGYVPQGYDTIGEVLAVLGEEILGFYDPATKSIYVIGDEARLSPDDEVTFAHEMTHALQDQHYDLKANQDAREHNNDGSTAYQALEEGDAVVNQSLYALRYERSTLSEDTTSGEVSASSALEQAPLVIQRELYFPYEEGANFVVSAYLNGGWTAVDDIWANPPTSTAQIIHPEKYRDGQEPVELDLPDLASRLGGDWSEIDDDNIGELDLRTLIEQYVDRPTADDVAGGWDGDHYKLLRRESDGAVVLALRTAWASPDAAQAFVSAYEQVATSRYGDALQAVSTNSLIPAGSAPADTVWEGQAGSWDNILIRDGADVAVIVATDPAGKTVADALRPAP